MADTSGTESAQGSDARDTRHVEAEDDEECSDGDGHGSKSESLGSDLKGILLQVINASKKAMDRQLEEFKVEFRRTSCQVTERLEKRLKTGRSLDFRRKGNELQYLFNEEVDRKLDEVEESLASLPMETVAPAVKSPVKRARQALQEGRGTGKS